MNEYIFDENVENQELYRLRLIESALDDHSKSLITRCGLRTGKRFLEIGAGAGSIMLWLGQQTGSNGRVTAIDKNTKYIDAINFEPFEIINKDIFEYQPKEKYDLIHARYVLIHNKNALAILKKLREWVKPDGFIVLEEPDFTTARSLNENEGANSRVNKAISKMFNDLGLNPGFGTYLPKEAEKIGFKIFYHESKMHLNNGNSLMALMMGKSAEALKEKYVATGIASNLDVEEYIGNSKNDKYWQVYYSTVSVILKSGQD